MALDDRLVVAVGAGASRAEARGVLLERLGMGERERRGGGELGAGGPLG